MQTFSLRLGESFRLTTSTENVKGSWIMPDETRTSGELLFQEYLKDMEYEYEFERSFPGKSKRPDYTMTRNEEFLFDVKDFDPVHPNKGFGTFDPYPPIREKINQGCEKFREFKDYSCSLVMRIRCRSMR